MPHLTLATRGASEPLVRSLYVSSPSRSLRLNSCRDVPMATGNNVSVGFRLDFCGLTSAFFFFEDGSGSLFFGSVLVVPYFFSSLDVVLGFELNSLVVVWK